MGAGNASADSAEGNPAEAGFVGVVLVCLFFALYRGYYTPEVVVSLVGIDLFTAVFCAGVRNSWLEGVSTNEPS